MSVMEENRREAQKAGLIYVYDDQPGLARRRHGSGFTYLDSEKQRLTCAKTLQRVKSLAIPPAWQNVWICPAANGHLQATGYDDRERKQYSYHEKWREARDLTKFENMTVFGRALPAIRRKILESLSMQELPKEKVVAAVIRMLDKTGLRIGNDIYSKTNNSFGLTTLRKKHVDVSKTQVELEFPAKGRKLWHGVLQDPYIVRIIRTCEDLPGYRLFQYKDENGNLHDIGSADINTALQAWAGASVTAKDFRTWHGCTVFLREAMRSARADGKPLKDIIDAVAQKLGNTPAIARKSYIHPDLMRLYGEGSLDSLLPEIKAPVHGLGKYENALLGWLESI